VTPKLLTVGEVATLASRLTGQGCTPRQVRYLLVDGGLGTESGPRPQGQTRMYGVIDLAIVCLARRMQSAGMSSAVARAVLTYRRDDIVRAWKAGANAALVVTGLHGAVVPAAKATSAKAAATVPLQDVWRGLDAEIERLTRTRPTVWMWRDVPVHAVPRSIA